MKRLWTVSLAVLFAASIAGAEEMRFITTLSSPVGTFAQLETANPEVNTEVPVVNFCNTGVNSGKMTLSGANAYVQKLSLQPGTVLGGDVKEYRLAGTLAVYNAGQVTGGRLIANRVQVFSSTSDAYSQVSDTLYGSGIDLEGAKTTNLTIPGKVQTVNQGDGEELEWSNIYTKDYTCDSKGNCKESGGSYTSYLLKSVGGTVEETPDCSVAPEGNTKKYKECSCGGTLYARWDKEACEYVPDDAVDVQVNCMSYYCDSGDGAHINNSGCKIDGDFTSSFEVPFYIYKYDWSMLTAPSDWEWRWKKQDSLTSNWTWTEQCGWPDGMWNDSKSCAHGFGFSSSGAQTTTVTCGDCTYNIEMYSDSSDEEWGSSYCDGRAF